MGHLVNPISFRLGKTFYWNFVWSTFLKKNYRYLILQDFQFIIFLKWLLSFNFLYKLKLTFSHFKILRLRNKIVFVIFFVYRNNKNLSLFDNLEKARFLLYKKDKFKSKKKIVLKKYLKLWEYSYYIKIKNILFFFNKKLKNLKKIFLNFFKIFKILKKKIFFKISKLGIKKIKYFLFLYNKYLLLKNKLNSYILLYKRKKANFFFYLFKKVNFRVYLKKNIKNNKSKKYFFFNKIEKKIFFTFIIFNIFFLNFKYLNKILIFLNINIFELKILNKLDKIKLIIKKINIFKTNSYFVFKYLINKVKILIFLYKKNINIQKIKKKNLLLNKKLLNTLYFQTFNKKKLCLLNKYNFKYNFLKLYHRIFSLLFENRILFIFEFFFIKSYFYISKFYNQKFNLFSYILNTNNQNKKKNVIYSKANLISKSIVDLLKYKKLGIKKAINIVIKSLRYIRRISGYKIVISGRLTRKRRGLYLVFKNGKVPLSTLKIPIDYSFLSFKNKFGICGIKVWLNKKLIENKKIKFLYFFGIKMFLDQYIKKNLFKYKKNIKICRFLNSLKEIFNFSMFYGLSNKSKFLIIKKKIFSFFKKKKIKEKNFYKKYIYNKLI